MAYLNWKESKVDIEVSPHSRYQTQAEVKLDEGLVQILVAALEEVYLKDEGELRLALPKGWVIFWKKRGQGNRVLLAHPQLEEWVATVALEWVHAEQMLSALKTLPKGKSLTLSSLGALEYMTNLELSLST